MNMATHNSEHGYIMPLLFLGHGSPMNVIEKNQFTEEWQAISATFPKPNAILCISAHRETKGTLLSFLIIIVLPESRGIN